MSVPIPYTIVDIQFFRLLFSSIYIKVCSRTFFGTIYYIINSDIIHVNTMKRIDCKFVAIRYINDITRIFNMPTCHLKYL